MSIRDKAELAKELKKLAREVDKTVDHCCGDSRPADDLLLNLCALAQKAVDSLPDPGDAVIWWQPQDLQNQAADMGFPPLGRKRARQLLKENADGIEEGGVRAGWDMIGDIVREEYGNRAKRRKQRKTV